MVILRSFQQSNTESPRSPSDPASSTASSQGTSVVRERNQRSRKRTQRLIESDATNFLTTRDNGAPRTTRSQSPTSVSQPLSQASIEEGEIVELTQSFDLPDQFLQRSGLAGDTAILDIPSDKLGVLSMLPNSITDIPRDLLDLVKQTYTKLLADALHPRASASADDKFSAFKKLLLAATVVLTARQQGEFVPECSKRCNLILSDDWSMFTLEYLAGHTDTAAEPSVHHEEAAQRHTDRAVRKYLEVGNLKKGMQRVVDNNPAADGNLHTLQKLQAKHPSLQDAGHAATRRVTIPNAQTIELHPDDVSMSIRMAAKGAKHGLDKLRPEHLHQLTAGDVTCGLLKAFTELFTRVVNNNIDQRLLPYLRDAEIIAARKGDNDVRPIVICGTIRKISLAAARRAFSFTRSKVFEYQYGLARGGAERIINSMRTAIEINNTYNIVVLDAANAFNSASRNAAIDMVEEHFPVMMPIVQALYGTTATIWYNGMSDTIAQVLAAVGFQQGCVLGSWLYCLSLQKLINLIIEALDNDGLPFFYVDDGNLMATFEATLRVFEVLKTRGPEFGYIIKWEKAQYLLGKCASKDIADARKAELIAAGFLAHNVFIHPDNIGQPSAQDMQAYGVTVLGGFIGSDEFIKHKLTTKLESTQAECEALIRLPDLQSRYMLLNWCFKSKVHYWLRTTKLDLTKDFIAGFDAQKQAVLLSIMDNNNSTGTSTLTEEMWRIVQLPTKFGGLGLENLNHVRHAAVIAAVLLCDADIGCSNRMESPLVPNEPCSIVRDFHSALAVMQQINPALSWSKFREMSKRSTSTLQHDLTTQLQKRDIDTMLSPEIGPQSISSAAHFNWITSLQSKEAGLWLTVYKTKGFKLSNEEFQVALLHRCFGVQPSLMPNLKCKCGNGDGHVDNRGHHLITGCSREGVRQATHDSITSQLYNILRMYGIYSRKEVCPFKRTHPKSKKRLDIVIAEGQLGSDKKILLDVTITNPVNSHTRGRRVSQNSAAIHAHTKKLNKYSAYAADENCVVKPMVWESTGSLHPDTIHLLKCVAGVDGSNVCLDSKNLYRYWMRMISVTLQRSIARAFIKGRNRLMSNNYKVPKHLSQYSVNVYNDLYVMNHLSNDE